MIVSLFVRGGSLINPWRYLTNRGTCSKLFIGGLCYDTNEPVLKNAFEKYGDVIEVRVICDHMNGKSKGYGFVLFGSEEAAATALASMNNQLLEGRNIRVEYAQTKAGLYQNHK
ncbi:unnamed protein product [Cochlearia groenlandica]